MSPRELQIFLYQHALVPVRYLSPGWAVEVGLSPTDFTPFLTNTFLHGGWLHLILNMWTLWIFGPALEDRLGPVRFTIIYLLTGVAASVTHVLFHATSTTPVLGASGAIAGIIAAYAVRFPYAWVRVLVLIVFVSLFILVTLFELLPDIVKNNIDSSIVATYFVYLLPQILYYVIPLTVLLAILIDLGSLTKSNEILAVKAGAVSLYRMAMPLLIMGLLL